MQERRFTVLIEIPLFFDTRLTPDSGHMNMSEDKFADICLISLVLHYTLGFLPNLFILGLIPVWLEDNLGEN